MRVRFYQIPTITEEWNYKNCQYIRCIEEVDFDKYIKFLHYIKDNALEILIDEETYYVDRFYYQFSKDDETIDSIDVYVI